jgi:hypothetical protein
MPAGYTDFTVGLINTHYVFLPTTTIIESARTVDPKASARPPGSLVARQPLARPPGCALLRRRRPTAHAAGLCSQFEARACAAGRSFLARLGLAQALDGPGLGPGMGRELPRVVSEHRARGCAPAQGRQWNRLKTAINQPDLA